MLAVFLSIDLRRLGDTRPACFPLAVFVSIDLRRWGKTKQDAKPSHRATFVTPLQQGGFNWAAVLYYEYTIDIVIVKREL